MSFNTIKPAAFPDPGANRALSGASTPNHPGGDFASSLTLRLASLQAQSVSQLVGSADASSALDIAAPSGDPLPGAAKTASLSADGRNRSLFDPESAYQMMSEINRRDVVYKAQFAELSQMEQSIDGLAQAAKRLASATGADAGAVATRNILGEFADTYNRWVERFEDDIEPGGLLSGTQAAEISLHELEYSVENRFHGAALGFNGLKDLGVSIDPASHRISVDGDKLDAALAANRQGVFGTVQAFAAEFTQAATLLASDGNFIDNRLANLDRAIDFIDSELPALQSEFGLGAPAKPSASAANALAAYQRMHANG